MEIIVAFFFKEGKFTSEHKLNYRMGLTPLGIVPIRINVRIIERKVTLNMSK